jgi:hypothetical protein
MPTTYRIHPGIGIARLGNSPTEFCITPEKPAALPLECDASGNPIMSPDGLSDQTITTFKDAEGRIKRQAARFQIFVFDDESPQGRPLKIGDQISGGGNQGTLIDIQWQVYIANKKSMWYRFQQLEGEHGYASTHARRNADITDPDARQRLIIDPGPRVVSRATNRTAQFSREGGDAYSPTFPPPLKPHSIDTLGELKTDDDGRLLVLGGHGNSGTFRSEEFGQPRIDEYANNDGWFDDTSDGPVMARLVMFSENVTHVRYVDVESPAWVIVGYPAYVPQILDMVTMNELIEDMEIRQFAARTDLYGAVGTFGAPQQIDSRDLNALSIWRAGRLQWNPAHKPWFYRDIWSILFRPDQYSYLANVLGQSNFPHNQSARGNFDPTKLSIPPSVDATRLAECEAKCVKRHHAGDLFVQTLAPALEALEKQADSRAQFARGSSGGSASAVPARLLSGHMAGALRVALSDFARAVHGTDLGANYAQYLRKWRSASETSSAYTHLKDTLDKRIAEILAEHPLPAVDQLGAALRDAVMKHLQKYHTGRMLEECRLKCIESCTNDPYKAYRAFLFELLREPGAGNQFGVRGTATSRVHNLPLMPLLCGDNPITNTLSSKFLHLTEYQFYLLRQWAEGKFYNEIDEGWSSPDPWEPWRDWTNTTARDLDRGVLSNVLGGAFCPGGEVGWIMRNPAIYQAPYRIKADPEFSQFRQTAAQDNADRGVQPGDYLAFIDDDLSQNDDFDTGLQPGDLTKHMGTPWQADFNECSTQVIDVTYEAWNQIFADSVGDSQMTREQRVWETLWWPAHRPMQSFELTVGPDGQPSYAWRDWARGIPQTNAGDLKMVTEWWRLGIIRLNPFMPSPDVLPSEVPPPDVPPYVSVERTEHRKETT